MCRDNSFIINVKMVGDMTKALADDSAVRRKCVIVKEEVGS